MSNAVFPVMDGLRWNIIRQPAYNTKVQRAVSGKEYRAAFMQYPLMSYTLAYDLLRDTAANQELQQLCGFFLARQGSYDTFLFTDPVDSLATLEPFGTGTAGGQTVFPLYRTFGAGGFTAADYVQNPYTAAGFHIYDNGVEIVQGAGAGKYTINSTGVVTFGTAPANGNPLTWSGAFYYRCRFLADTLDFNNFMTSMWDLNQLKFIGSLQNKVGT